MGDEKEGAPKSESARKDAQAVETVSKALAPELNEDEPSDDPSKKEISKEKPEEKKEEKPSGKEEEIKEEEPAVDLKSALAEVEELRSLKGSLGEKLGLQKKEADHYKTLYEDLSGKATIKAEEQKLADEFEKFNAITDPAEFAKQNVALSVKKGEEAGKKAAKAVIKEAKDDLKRRSKVWSKLTKDYPDLKDESSEMYKQTHALMVARGWKIDNADAAALVVDSQLKLLKAGKKTEKVAAELKGKKIIKTKQTGLKQPAKKIVSSPGWDAMSPAEKSAAGKIGLGPEDYKEAK